MKFDHEEAKTRNCDPKKYFKNNGITNFLFLVYITYLI